MVFGGVQGREVKPVGLDLRALGHIKTHGTKDGLNAFQGERYRMQTTPSTLATWQGDIKGLGSQLRIEFSLCQSLTPVRERLFDSLLGSVDDRTARLFLVGIQGGQALHQLGQPAGLAQKYSLGVLQLGWTGSGLKAAVGLANQIIESRRSHDVGAKCRRIDKSLADMKKGQSLQSPSPI